jgi:hypothetical protein
MERKTPAAQGGRGMELLAGASVAPITLTTLRAQHIAARYALPIEQAAIVAALAFGGAHHG